MNKLIKSRKGDAKTLREWIELGEFRIKNTNPALSMAGSNIIGTSEERIPTVSLYKTMHCIKSSNVVEWGDEINE